MNSADASSLEGMLATVKQPEARHAQDETEVEERYPPMACQFEEMKMIHDASMRTAAERYATHGQSGNAGTKAKASSEATLAQLEQENNADQPAAAEQAAKDANWRLVREKIAAIKMEALRDQALAEQARLRELGFDWEDLSAIQMRIDAVGSNINTIDSNIDAEDEELVMKIMLRHDWTWRAGAEADEAALAIADRNEAEAAWHMKKQNLQGMLSALSWHLESVEAL